MVIKINQLTLYKGHSGSTDQKINLCLSIKLVYTVMNVTVVLQDVFKHMVTCYLQTEDSKDHKATYNKLTQLLETLLEFT